MGDNSSKYGMSKRDSSLRVQPHQQKSIQQRAQERKAHVYGCFRLVRRLLVLATAVWYTYVSLGAAVRSMILMRGVVGLSLPLPQYVSSLIPHYVGKSTIRLSPLVVEVLGNSTAPRHDSVYLQTENQASFTDCGPDMTASNAWIYGNDYIRHNLADVVAQTSYNLTFLTNTELIVPVVDCSSSAIVLGDQSTVRVFYLVRSKNNHDDVYVLTWTSVAQDYQLVQEHQLGPTSSITLTYNNDVRDKSVTYHHIMRLGFPYQMSEYKPYTLLRLDAEGFWVLESIPRDPASEPSRVVRTAARTGFFVNAETEQCNVINLNENLEANPADAMCLLGWSARASVRDSWAWVHGIHFFFALDTLLNLVILMVVIYHNIRKGKVWVGDAFVSVSSTIAIRAALVLLSSWLNGFWTIMEFCLSEGNALMGVASILTYPHIIHADLLTLYLGLADLLGHLLRERIDPALAVILFELGFQNCRMIATWFPTMMEASVAFARNEFFQGLSPMEPKYTAFTPIRLWTTHQLNGRDTSFIFTALFPVFVSFAGLVAYVPIRKVYRYYCPARKITMSKASGVSTGAEALLAWKSSLTVFEVATGAPLQNRVGLVTDYDNCIYIKGLKYASADGIYCNGYVIAQGKWLISTEDLLAIVIMIITRVRFKNVYVYEVNNFTVQQTARLVYSQTMALQDLVQLNVSILS